MSEISIIIPSEKDYYDLSLMVGELLNETERVRSCILHGKVFKFLFS